MLKEPFGLVEFMLGAGAPIPVIMREKDAKRPENEPMTEPIGSGPFNYIASERVSGHRVVFAIPIMRSGRNRSMGSPAQGSSRQGRVDDFAGQRLPPRRCQ